MEKDKTPQDVDTSEKTNPRQQPLQSWKEIAAYLERDERTARRWEKTEGLAVRRHGSGPRSSVYAYPSELNAWRLARRPRLSESRQTSPLVRWVAAAASSLFVLLLAVWFVKYSPVFNPPSPIVEAAQGITVKEVRAGGYSEGGPSPDGQLFCFMDWEKGDIAIENLQTGERRHLTNKGNWEEPREFAMSYAISPDGTQVAYDWWRNEVNELWVVGIDGSDPRLLLGEDVGYYHETVASSADGRHIATWGGPGTAKIL